jgi:hypothetical protein
MRKKAKSLIATLREVSKEVESFCGTIPGMENSTMLFSIPEQYKLLLIPQQSLHPFLSTLNTQNTHFNIFSHPTSPPSPPVYCILELLRDAFHSKVSILQIILEVNAERNLTTKTFSPLVIEMTLQALKVESGYICLIVIIFLISLIPFCYTIAWCFSRNVKLKAANGVSDIVQASARAVLPEDVMLRDGGKGEAQ